VGAGRPSAAPRILCRPPSRLSFRASARGGELEREVGTTWRRAVLQRLDEQAERQTAIIERLEVLEGTRFSNFTLSAGSLLKKITP